MKDASDAILHTEQAMYLEALEAPRDALLQRMEAHAKEHRCPISDPEVASFLAVTVRASGARRIVEVGTNIGYGAVVMARAAGPEGRVVTLELDAALGATARRFAAEAGLSERIEVREGRATDELARIEGPIDLAYLDCVKEEYVAYLELIVPKLSARGVIIADNVLWKGLVAKREVPPNEVKRTEALRAFNRALMTHPSLRAVVLPLGDGVAYAVKAT
jgi:predicted O-methyltransferase YrrM